MWFELDRHVEYRRVLCSRRHLAQKDHGMCYVCHQQICAGEEYEVEVVALRVRFKSDGSLRVMLETWKCHYPPCQPPEEPWDEDDEYTQAHEEQDIPFDQAA